MSILRALPASRIRSWLLITAAMGLFALLSGATTHPETPPGADPGLAGQNLTRSTFMHAAAAEAASVPENPAGGQLAPPSGPSYVELAAIVASALDGGTAEGGYWPQRVFQSDGPIPVIPEGAFVWGPEVGDFDIRSFLTTRGSNLAPFASDVELWARYTSVNPKLLLAMLELKRGFVTQLPADTNPVDVRAEIEQTAMDLAQAFYEHLYIWGSRRPAYDPQARVDPPAVTFADGSAAQLSPALPSGSFAVAAATAREATPQEWVQEIFGGGGPTFAEVFGALFPDTPLGAGAAGTEINPPSLPPDNLFQFPFPLGAIWGFGGPHSWSGSSTPPFSSMDFYAGGMTCQAPPNLYAVAAAAGTAIRPYGYDCWLEIDHGNGWTTSYYHLRNMIDPQGGTVERNAAAGTIACETCAGGWATGPHVHWSLKYNGAYVSLEGVKLSGWTIHVGPEAYNSGYIERDGTRLDPWSGVLNDYDLYYAGGEGSLRFFGNGTGDIDRVKIPLDAPARPVDVGASDFTLEFWMKADLAENPSPDCSPGGDNWIYGNILFDRDVFGNGDLGDYGLSLANGRLAFGVDNGTAGDTLCGSTLVADGQWHHVAVTRALVDGMLRLFVDGQLDGELDGPDGDISYNDGRTTTYTNDPYLVIGAEKHDAGPSYPSFSGWIDEVRFSDTLRYAAPFAPPSAPFTTDGNTLALYHFNEGSGDAVNDSSGAWGGPSNGQRMFGGSPAGPLWSPENPFLAPPPTATATLGPTETSTPIASPTPTASATPTASDTPTPTIEPSPVDTPTPTDTPLPSPTNTPLPSDTPTAAPAATDTPGPTPTPTGTSATETPTPDLPPTATAEASTTPVATATPSYASEDIDLDGMVNILDLQLCINVFLGAETDPQISARADVNGDGGVNVLDVQQVVNSILAG